ncbi:uncharacterized protein I303_100667 [Kwoniella dejecticola CBS 10117]|uniref:Aldehyde dehydrogenase domain-containing protein n=1 Tax=Kwoniella dejecticola CBS 10117 TaxID=1296121 RepID=A0A1A6AFM7_9TREE|nr:uncharacterized protein I303_00671 [Kwoniella dejecticola CBS 10117]OBR88854.1 hypothetical protein I303_00671 [Kwoniella dejecticola CBS 10117]
MPLPFRPGTYAPVLTFFEPKSEALDIETFKRHVSYMAKAGVGPVVTGSMGEGPMLSIDERLQLVKAAREVLDEHKLPFPLIVGTGLTSTKETIALTEQAAAAGADVALVIPAGYYPTLMTRKALKMFFMDVQDASPIPVMIYNFPGASAGVDMDSDLLLELAKEGRNFCGAKLTCAQIGKITRLAGYCDTSEYLKQYPRSFQLRQGQKPFVVFSGFSDYLLAGSAARAHGAIAGIGNFAPRSFRHLYEAAERANESGAKGDVTEARTLQLILSEGDYATTKLHIPGAKRILQDLRGYGGHPRGPIQPIEESLYQASVRLPAVQRLFELEKSLEAKAQPDSTSVGSSSEHLQRTISPIDQSVVVTRHVPSDADVETIIATSQIGFVEWKTTDLEARLAIATRFLKEMETAKADLSEDLSRQMGRPIAHCAVEVEGTIKRGQHMVNIAKEVLGDVTNQDTDSPGYVRFIKRCPVGPVLVISPWNYPYFCQVNAVLPAILAGNSVILKPSPQTPLCGEWFVELYKRAGLPDGVLQTLHSTPDQIERVIKDARIQFVMFTGSVAVGRSIVKALSGTFKNVGLELGGKDPAYVREDADLQKTLPALAAGIFFNAGQSCCSVERVYAHASIYDRVVEGLAHEAKKLKLGNPEDPSVTLGPVVSRRSADFIRKQVAEAVKQGAKMHVSAELFPAAHGNSNFVAPQVLSNVSHAMSIMIDETFGPVVGVMKVDSDEEAIKHMNDSPYGLTASVWTDATKSKQAFEFIVEKLDTGTVYLNNADNLDPALAWSGWKDSGRGISLSKFGFDAFTHTKSVNIKYL